MTEGDLYKSLPRLQLSDLFHLVEMQHEFTIPKIQRKVLKNPKF